MRKTHKRRFDYRKRTNINNAIRSRELRVIGVKGENLGILPLKRALEIAEKSGLDLIEISPNTNPPIAKIMDFGQYRYEKKRKASEVKAKSHITETKSVQVKIGTSEHDQLLKAKRVADWLKLSHRVKIDLFLWGRYKYMDSNFLQGRLKRFMKIIPAEYRVAEEIKKSSKGWSCIIEKAGKISQKNLDEKEKIQPEIKKTGVQKIKTKKTLEDLIDLEGGLP